MTPIYFGPPKRRLFGLYHAAAQPGMVERAALLCYPYGHEMLRIHRFYRLMAERLARQGIAVLRFDYHGTGDSPGEDEDGDLEGWAGDIREAHRELMQRSGTAQITWFGARIGAAVALMAAPQTVPAVRRLVLWDPVFDGSAYLHSLREALVDELEHSHTIPDPDWRRSIERNPNAFAGESLGFAMSPLLHAQIAALRPDSPPRLAPAPIRLLAREDDVPAQQWTRAVQAAHPGVDLRLLPFGHPLIWTSNPHANNEVVPAQALQRMIGEIHGNQ